MIGYIRKLAVPTLILAWATHYFAEVCRKPAEAQVLIRPAYYLLLALYLLICYTEYKAFRGEASSRESIGKKLRDERALFCIALSGLYVAVVPYIGFLTATTIFLTLAFCRLGARRKVVAVVAALSFTLAAFWLFGSVFSVPLPMGGIWR